jgi:amino acid adenylation domain-containing protein
MSSADSSSLSSLFANAARNFPEHVAVVDGKGPATYGAVDALVNRIGRALRAKGLGTGDRVGIWLDKSVKALAVMQAALRAGAAYVPLDPQSPWPRIEKILRDCDLRVVVTDDQKSPALAPLGIPSLTTHAAQGTEWPELDASSPAPLDPVPVAPGDLAYVLYTSGSTGAPKGVCISHAGARAFVDWAVGEIGLSADDRLANHAPFHFDLSVFDVYGAFAVGAAVCIVPETVSFMAKRLVRFAVEQRITVWYSVPSALVLMLEQGGMAARDLEELRAILFAGEAFPIERLRRLRDEFPHAKLYNLYGPTETNVCTFHAIDRIAPETTSVPIGRACSGDDVWAEKPDGTRCATGEEGELFVEGPSVMLGYWGKPPQRGRYPTGDVVRVLAPGVYGFVGRKDRLVKVRGHRVELGDVEAALLEHENVEEVAVVVHGEGPEARLVACVVPSREPPPSLLSLKGHSAERLPRYMILDEVKVFDRLPRTRNGKLDHELLLAGHAGP